VQPYILFLSHLELSYMARYFASLSWIDAIHEKLAYYSLGFTSLLGFVAYGPQ
jgi:hypothetical protein